MREAFLKQYYRVFDSRNNIMACGRLECIQLINLANILEPDISHGNINTGHMKVEKIRELKIKEFGE